MPLQLIRSCLTLDGRWKLKDWRLLFRHLPTLLHLPLLFSPFLIPSLRRSNAWRLLEYWLRQSRPGRWLFLCRWGLKQMQF